MSQINISDEMVLTLRDLCERGYNFQKAYSSTTEMEDYALQFVKALAKPILASGRRLYVAYQEINAVNGE